MSLNFYNEIVKLAHVELPNCPVPLLEQQCQMTVMEFFQRTWAWKEQLDVIPIQIGVRDYELNDYIPEATVLEAIVSATVEGSAIRANMDYFVLNRTTLRLAGTPTAYIANGLQAVVALRPCPNALCVDNENFDRIWTDMFRGIAMGVAGFLQRQANQTWSNEQRAIVNLNMYENYMRRAISHRYKGDMAIGLQARPSTPFLRIWRRRPIAGN